MTAAFEMTLETLSLNRPQLSECDWSVEAVFLSLTAPGCEHQAQMW
jgi:hypothetical protein